MATDRLRLRGTAGTTHATGLVRWLRSPHPPEDHVYDASFYGTRESIADEKHPGYKRRMNDGEVIMGDLVRSITSRKYTGGEIFLYDWGNPVWRDYTNSITGDLVGFAEKGMFLPPSTWENDLTNMCDVAIVKAYANVRDDSIMSGEIMASIGQSLEMLRSPFGTFRKLVKKIHTAAKRNYRKTARSVTQANAGAWLEYRYGWAPLFLDMRTGFDLYLQAEARMRRARKVARGAELGTVTSSQENSDIPTYLNPWGLKFAGSVEQKVKYSAHGGVIYTVGNRTPAQDAAESLRLGADSLFQTAWEVVPYSFVWDWVQLVGPWLEAMNLPISVDVQGNWVTTVVQEETDYMVSDVRWFNPSEQNWIIGTGGYSNWKVATITRVTNRALPSYPPMALKLPGLIRATDGIALLTSPITGLLRALKH